MRAIYRRYGTLNVPIIGVGVILYGTLMLLSAASSYGSPAYANAFDFMPKNVWAVSMIGSGILSLAVLTWWALFPLCLIVTGWAVALMSAGISLPGVANTVGLFPLMVAISLLVGVARRGARVHHDHDPTSPPPRR